MCFLLGPRINDNGDRMAEAVSELDGIEDASPLQGEVILHSFGSENKKAGSVLLIVGGTIDIAQAQNLTQFLNKEFHIYALGSDFKENRIFAFADQLVEKLEVDKAKRLTVIGIGRGTLLAHAVAVTAPGLVRRVALVDPYLRTPTTSWERIVASIERVVPFGLPFRKIRREFDMQPFAHRLRAPSLLLSSPTATAFQREQIEYMHNRVPNCRVQLLRQPLLTDTGAIGMELSKIFRDFVAVPAKRSQKAGAED